MSYPNAQQRQWLAENDPAKLEAIKEEARIRRANFLKTKPPGYNAASVKKVYDKDRPGYNARMRQWRKDNPELAHKNDKSGARARLARVNANRGVKTSVSWQSQISGVFSGRRYRNPRLDHLYLFKARFGCLPAELIEHFKSLFLPGMTLDNYGRKSGQWCIDHIKPQRSFDFNVPGQLEVAFHYTNLRPMWFNENSSKNHGSEMSLSYSKKE